MALNSVKELIDDIRQGRMVVLMDDEDRENEGDLVMAAALVRPHDINFMARYARGLICLTLTRERCRQLRLPLMVQDTDARQSTNFTVSIEAAHGVTTGISAADRATTILAAVAPQARPEDVVQPGHVFPLMAQPGGVLTRAGHTEAGSDLARLAGLEPASVIVEILNEDGTMARRDQLEQFARQHGLKIGTIADLIEYRIRNEKTVQRIAECPLPTVCGTFRMYAYHESIDERLHLALVYGQPDFNDAVLVRVHLEDTMSDVLGAQRPDLPWPLREAMQRVAATGSGIIVVLRNGEDPKHLVRLMADYQTGKKGVNLPKPAAGDLLRTFGVGAQILVDLGVRQMRVIGTPKKMHGLSGFGLEVVEYLPGAADK
ncbi:MAG: 3,4-dihydroxy-2-butanone-4-phosphate synthase [Gammaproteobacteria bacterium]|nr:3,4-dihydroxy-2-butanone-4-phosphate synthase [Gammaproteobacteria bacterium]